MCPIRRHGVAQSRAHQEKASRKAALLSERAPKEDSASEARRRAERKHARKAARRTEKPSVIDQPRGPRTL